MGKRVRMPGNGAPSEGLKRVDPEAIDTIVAAHAGHEGALLPVLREVQEVVGYLPEWALKRVALGLGLSLSRVYGVATFYSLFTTKPKGQYVIRVCESAPCHVQGAQEVINALMRELGVGFGETTPDGRFTLEAVSCLGTCGVAPAVMIGDRVYGNLTPETVLTVLEEYS
jgi:NADH-quinone oxidoreductase E subunit